MVARWMTINGGTMIGQQQKALDLITWSLSVRAKTDLKEPTHIFKLSHSAIEIPGEQKYLVSSY